MRGPGASRAPGDLGAVLACQVPLSRGRPSGRPTRRVGFPAMNPAVKWVGSAVAIPVLTLAIYLFAVLQVYIIAWVVNLIGVVF